MKTLAKPLIATQPNLLGLVKEWFSGPIRTEKQNMGSIFNLASQRCAGFTTRPRATRSDDY